ncbi:MAG: hypothetical protein J5821_04575 [Alphaproteobacteria bacterium]|nr:hypothetical protein [Alphaproteobacteria bacterium]
MNNINKLNENNKLFIEKFETAEASGKTMKELGINRDVYWAYKRSTEAGNDLINFYDMIDEEDAEDIIKCCRENGVKEFTISSNSTGMIRAIMALEAHRCHLNGTAMVNRDNLRIDAKQIPAFKIEIL